MTNIEEYKDITFESIKNIEGLLKKNLLFLFKI